MNSNRTDRSFRTDTRAVSQVIGFILLFGILTIAFTGYQAQVVPQQNAETEFEHFQENRDDLIDLRSAILTAGASERQQFSTVKLGTTYRTRILALNSPPPAGLIQTSDPYPINISDGNPGTPNVTVQTRFLEYQPGYHRFDVGSTWYENSVLYLDSTEPDGERVIIEDHNLVTNGDTLRITALQNNFQRSGTGRVTLELYPSSVEGNISQLDDDVELTVKLPTRLDRDDWDDQFNNSDTVNYNGFNNSEFDPGVNQLDLTVNRLHNLELNTVGIREEPTEGPEKNMDTRNTRDDTDEEDVAANIVYNDDSFPFSDGTGVEFSISNTGSSAATIESISVDTDQDDAADLTESNGGSGPGRHEIYIEAQDNGWYEAGDGGNDRYTLGNLVDLTNTATVSPGGTGTVYLYEFYDGSPGGSGDFIDVQNAQITVTFIFSDGSERTFTFENGSYS